MNHIAFLAYSVGPPWLLVVAAILVLGLPIQAIISGIVFIRSLIDGPSKRLAAFAGLALILAVVVAICISLFAWWDRGTSNAGWAEAAAVVVWALSTIGAFVTYRRSRRSATSAP
jgi:hypothetical protein